MPIAFVYYLHNKLPYMVRSLSFPINSSGIGTDLNGCLKSNNLLVSIHVYLVKGMLSHYRQKSDKNTKIGLTYEINKNSFY